MFQSILCAVDGSELALRAAQVAGEIAGKFGSKLTFLTVTKEIKMTDAIKRYMEIEHLSGEPQYILDEHTEQVLGDAKKAARNSGAKEARTVVKTGNPARSIMNFVDREKIDCLVIGSRGLGDFEGMLLGSVSHKVTSLAKCTCVVVR